MFALGKTLFLRVLHSFWDCFTSQSGMATTGDKTNFTTQHRLSMFYFIPYSKHTAPKIQYLHRVDFTLCLLTWMYGPGGTHCEQEKTLKDKMKRQSKSPTLLREQTPTLATF